MKRLERSTKSFCGDNTVTALARAADIVRADETLLTVYLLKNARTNDPASLTDERASRFLLWFAIEGRHQHQHAVFSPAYLAFLAAPIAPFASRLAAYVLLSRADLRVRFGRDPDRYHAWYYTEGIRELRLTPLIGASERVELLAADPRFASEQAPLTRYQYFRYLSDAELVRRFNPDQNSDRVFLSEALADRNPRWLEAPIADRSDLPGVNVIGFTNSVMRLGEDARALVAALSRAGIPCSIVNVSLSDAVGTSAPNDFNLLECDRPLFPINVFALPPFETARLLVERGAQLFRRRYSIGYWPWELNNLPDHWHGVFNLVDEVWAPSQFLFDVYQRLTDKPVFLMPPYLNIPKPVPFELESYGIKADDAVFLTLCDFNSFTSRKNPEGAINAFRQAFPKPGPERLIIKTLNAHAQPAALRAIEALIGGDPRFVVMTEALSRPQIAGLIQRADCLIALHRAEGFGRVIAEAMALGTIVVATDWSGSTSFLDHTRGYPVSYTLRDVAAGEYIFHQGSQWAEPSVENAALKLRKVRRHLGDDNEIRHRAKTFVDAAYGLDAVTSALSKRLLALSSQRPPIST